MDAGYAWKNETPFFTIYNDTRSVQNLFTGTVYVPLSFSLERAESSRS